MCEFACANLRVMDAITSLRRYQRANGLTQVALASRLGVTPAQVSMWLSGQRGPSLLTALQVQDRTGGLVPAASWKAKRRRPAA